MLLTSRWRENPPADWPLMMFVARNQKNLKRIGSFFLSKITIGHMLRRNSFWSGGPENAFNTKKQLSSHIHQYHKNNKDCDQCSKSFSTSTNRIAHEATHIVTCLSVNLVTKFTLTRPLIRNTWRIVLEVKHQLSHFIAMTVTKRFQEIVISQGTWEHILVSSLIHNNVINQS